MLFLREVTTTMQKATVSPSTPLAESNHPGECTILIVDDLEENLDLLEDILSERSYRTVRARNGLEALEILKVTVVDVIVADAMMPRMDGFELCKAVRKLKPYAQTPFIIHSANYVDKEDEEFARRLGVDRYVVKDPGLVALMKAVEELLVRPSPPESGLPPVHNAQIDEPTFLEKHHSMVSKKLEEKMSELELYAETLNRRNRELQASEARYRSLFEYASVAIFVIDRRSGKVVDVNRMGTLLLRSSREEILTMAHIPFIEKSPLPLSMEQEATYFTGESAIRARDGEIIEVEMGASPVAQPHDTRLILFLRDVTEQRKMRQQLLEAEKMMMMGCFATGIAHEIRNPLTAVTLNLQYLLHKRGNDVEIREYVESAAEATQRIGHVVENTLNLARRTPLVPRWERVNAVVSAALRFVRIPLQEKNLRISVRLGDSLPAVSLDAKEVQQALLNLLQNAIEVSPRGGTISVITSTHQRAGTNDKRAKVEIAVVDSGPGIRNEDLARLFEPLRTTKSGGTGIGLALSKHIMERHGGEISLEPNPGGGMIARLVFIVTDETNNGGTHVQG